MRVNESHESYARDDEVHGPPDRQFGLVFAAVFAIVAAWPILRGRSIRWWSVGVAVAFLVLALAAPRVLAPLNRVWLRIGLVLHACASRIVLAIVFFLTVTPIGLLLRAWGKDPLRLRFDPGASTYWIERRPPGPSADTMSNQF